jgi:hypothetical protein
MTPNADVNRRLVDAKPEASMDDWPYEVPELKVKTAAFEGSEEAGGQGPCIDLQDPRLSHLAT